MNYLYHFVPRLPLIGRKLVPLNVLRGMDEEMYQSYAKKYKGRELLMQRMIPFFGCLWNDVVFLSPIPPKDLLEAYTKTGRTMHKRRFFRIDPKQLDHSQMAVWPCEDWGRGSPLTCIPFAVDDLDRYRKVPDRTLQYYREVVTDGKTGFPYAYVPHILVKGEIDLDQTEIIEV